AEPGERPERVHHIQLPDRSERDRPAHPHRHGHRAGRNDRPRRHQQQLHRQHTATPQSDLAVTMTDGKTTVGPGASNTYTITVTNNGPSTVSSLTLTDTIPAALLNPNFAPSAGAYDTNTGVWSGLSLASGQSVTLTLTGTIASNATGTITNT